MSSPDATELDVIVVGAGISGIAAGHYLQRECPDRNFAILEGRDAIGGTWDLFRYPGVRSDSDMFTLGFSFRPWTSDQTMAEGPRIRGYLEDAARAEGLLDRIRFGHRVVAASWDSASARWTLEVGVRGETQRLVCRFLYFGSGYYRYEQGHAPEWPGQAAFAGRIVHPQHWPADLDYAGQRVVVIGSGATAVTLVPAMAAQAAHVTMLQRSPSYILAIPGRDVLGGALQKTLPRQLAYRLIRWKNILVASALFQFARRRPAAARRLLVKLAHKAAGPGVDAKHLEPRYQPWDQRLCFVPDADLFQALRSGRASVVTDEIASFTPGGLRLVSGAELPADVVVTATGLQLQLFGGARITVDGREVQPGERLSYKGLMLSGVPNLVMSLGYTNASWTLKAELIARQACRILNHMRQNGMDICLPVHEGETGDTRPALDLSSGYVQRAAAELPRQASRRPWRLYQNYLLDLLALKFSPVHDAALRFSRRGATP
jgi:cation diffusion facilitator CzcD-associated flavoprotein CzcO